MNKKYFFQFICTLLGVGIALSAAAGVLKRKDSDIEYQVFYEKGEEYDVLFFGASVVHYGVYPMQLWNDYGITSYNMANDSERLAMTYHHIINALDYANPKLIVVDLTGMAWAGTTNDGTLKDHNFLDCVPLSFNKIMEVRAIFQKEEQMQYLCPWYIYHSRWESLEEKDFAAERNVYYGASFLSGSTPWEMPTEKDYELSRYGEVEAEKENILNIIELCKERNIKVVFTYFPCPARGGDQKLREYCENFLKENGADYIELLYLDTIDWNSDFIEDGHVNYYGGEKVTDYFGKLLSVDYGIQDHRGDEGYSSSWISDYAEYEQLVERYKTE